MARVTRKTNLTSCTYHPLGVICFAINTIRLVLNDRTETDGRR
jgi:hypothetical protein